MMLFTWYLELRACRSDLEASSYAPLIQRRFLKARSDFDGRGEDLEASFCLREQCLATQASARRRIREEKTEKVSYVQDVRCDRCALLEAGCCIEDG